MHLNSGVIKNLDFEIVPITHFNILSSTKPQNFKMTEFVSPIFYKLASADNKQIDNLIKSIEFTIIRPLSFYSGKT